VGDVPAEVEWKNTKERPTTVITYNNGGTQIGITEWDDDRLQTIYSWLKRLETDELLEQAMTNITDLRKNSSNHSKTLEEIGFLCLQ